jgi:6-phosphogluconolactonase
VPPFRPEVRIVENADALAAAAAEEFITAVRAGVEARGTASVALSGGSTPRRLYSLLAGPEHRDRVPWKDLDIFFGDERPVPPDDPESNYRMARETLLERAPISEAHVHRMMGEDPDLARAASSYASELRRHFGLAPGEFPRFDLALLGLGPDGHTASLFPGTRALASNDLAASNWVGKLDAVRLTLSAPVFNRSAHVVFLVSGPDKAPALKSVLRGNFEPQQLPAQLIRPDPGRLLWLVDRAAAALLSGAEAASR